MIAYIKAYVNKGDLPKEDGEYLTDQGDLRFVHGRFWPFTPTWWLKEIQLSELMVRFVQHYLLKHAIPYELDVLNGKITDQQKIDYLKNDVDSDWNELLTDYLIEQKIILE